jgi:small-conductance mechanosensitive channel
LVVTVLMAALGFMIARSLLAILFGSSEADAADRRLLPVSDGAAKHYRTRLTWAIGWFAFGHAFVQVLRSLDANTSVIELVAYALGIGLLVIGLEAVWRRPIAKTAGPGTDATPTNGAAARSWLYGVIFTAMWLLWVGSAMRLFWLVAVATALPLAIVWSRKAVSHLFRVEPAPESEAPASDLVAEPAPAHEAPAFDLVAVAVEGILRALLILASIWLLAWAWGVGFHSLAAGDTPLTKMVRSLFSVLVIVLVADLAWQLTKGVIDALLATASDPGTPGSPEATRRAKLRTLLPITRNVAMVFLATLAVLMVLSNLGVQIGPLIASAGVVGIAIGFGAQTVVKDIVSGMFYLLDDAFRIGEYIVSGKFMGTVESFSLRSVRLDITTAQSTLSPSANWARCRT